MAQALIDIEKFSSRLEGLEYLPGGEILLHACQSLAIGQWETEQVLLVSMYTHRLAVLGYHLPKLKLSPLSIKLKLYKKLSTYHDDPYAEFKAMELRLLKLLVYLERELLLEQNTSNH